jgi:hypothetical protein
LTTASETGGAGTKSGGAGDKSQDQSEGKQTSDDSGGDDDEGSKTVSQAAHQKALKDLHRFKTQAKEASTRLTALESQLEELKQKGMTEQNDFKSLFEDAKKKLAEKDEKIAGLTKSVTYGERYRAVLPALKEAGLRSDALNLVDGESLEELELEATSNGRFLVNGVEDYVASFKKKYPYAFQEKKGARGVASGTGQGGQASGGWTPAKLFQLEKECKAKGDMSRYHSAVKEWMKAGKPTS